MFKSRNIFPIFLKNSSFRIEYLMQCIKYSILKDMIIEENDNLRPDRFMVRAFGAQSYPPTTQRVFEEKCSQRHLFWAYFIDGCQPLKTQVKNPRFIQYMVLSGGVLIAKICCKLSAHVCFSSSVLI